MNAISDCLEIWHTEGGYKGTCLYQLWLECDKQARVTSYYSRKITPICCHAYRINRLREEAENWWVNRLTIYPQVLGGLKEIELKTRKIQRKNQQCVTIMQSRLTNKKRLLATPTRKTAFDIRCTDGVIILERLFNGVEESDLKPRSYNTKSNLV